MPSKQTNLSADGGARRPRIEVETTVAADGTRVKTTKKSYPDGSKVIEYEVLDPSGRSSLNRQYVPCGAGFQSGIRNGPDLVASIPPQGPSHTVETQRVVRDNQMGRATMAARANKGAEHFSKKKEKAPEVVGVAFPGVAPHIVGERIQKKTPKTAARTNTGAAEHYSEKNKNAPEVLEDSFPYVTSRVLGERIKTKMPKGRPDVATGAAARPEVPTSFAPAPIATELIGETAPEKYAKKKRGIRGERNAAHQDGRHQRTAQVQPPQLRRPQRQPEVSASSTAHTTDASTNDVGGSAAWRNGRTNQDRSAINIPTAFVVEEPELVLAEPMERSSNAGESEGSVSSPSEGNDETKAQASQLSAAFPCCAFLLHSLSQRRARSIALLALILTLAAVAAVMGVLVRGSKDDDSNVLSSTPSPNEESSMLPSPLATTTYPALYNSSSEPATSSPTHPPDPPTPSPLTTTTYSEPRHSSTEPTTPPPTDPPASTPAPPLPPVCVSAKLLPSDGEAYDWFGRSVAIDGDTVVVGARRDDTLLGSNSGSAYVFRRTGTDWAQEDKLLPDSGARDDEFGVSVALDGNTAVVGAYQYESEGTGKAYIFSRGSAGWSFGANLISNDATAGDEFGQSVATSGDYAVVGAPATKLANVSTGSVYVFHRTFEMWAQDAKIVPEDGSVGEQFGYSVAMNDAHDTLVVGTSREEGEGRVYIFSYAGNEWKQVSKILPEDRVAGSAFGMSVAVDGMDGKTVLIGAMWDDSNGLGSGAAYVYTLTGTQQWTYQAKLIPLDGAAGDLFGISVAVEGDMAIIGAAQWKNGGSGKAYVFVRTGTEWEQQEVLAADDGAAYHRFGTSVSISQGIVVAGSFGDVENGVWSGSAYIHCV